MKYTNPVGIEEAGVSVIVLVDTCPRESVTILRERIGAYATSPVWTGGGPVGDGVIVTRIGITTAAPREFVLVDRLVDTTTAAAAGVVGGIGSTVMVVGNTVTEPLESVDVVTTTMGIGVAVVEAGRMSGTAAANVVVFDATGMATLDVFAIERGSRESDDEIEVEVVVLLTRTVGLSVVVVLVPKEATVELVVFKATVNELDGTETTGAGHEGCETAVPQLQVL
jgi:hypothetical protein